VNAFSLKFLRQLDDVDGVEGAFLDADSTSCTKILVDDGFLLSCYEFYCIPPVQDFGTKAVARYTAVVRFAMFLV
jgi:hypothetical protein